MDVDPNGPVFTRYWRHNSGAAPLGFQPITIKLDGDLTSESGVIKAWVANNLTTQYAQGIVSLSAPQGWNLAPDQIHFNLRPGAYEERDVIVLRHDSQTEVGGIVARVQFEGRTYQDLLTFDRVPLEVETELVGREIRVTLRNRGGVPAEGFAEVLAPVEHWSEPGWWRPIVLTPRRQAVYTPAFQEQRLVFRWYGDRRPDFWMVVKVAANGHTVYQRVP